MKRLVYSIRLFTTKVEQLQKMRKK